MVITDDNRGRPMLHIGTGLQSRELDSREMRVLLKMVKTAQASSLPDPDRSISVAGQWEHMEGVLTRREIAILRQLAMGKLNKGIAEELEISIRTVETHVKHIKGPLNNKLPTQRHCENPIPASGMRAGMNVRNVATPASPRK